MAQRLTVQIQMNARSTIKMKQNGTLMEMVEQMKPPSYKEFEASPKNQIEVARMNKEEHMMRGLVQMAGPSRPAQRLPCAVIIPQRRPRKRQYGFYVLPLQ